MVNSDELIEVIPTVKTAVKTAITQLKTVS